VHPILGERRRLLLYLLTWLPVAVLLAALVVFTTATGWREAAALALPLALVYAFVCLSAWYPCQAAPLGAAGALRVLSTQAAAALVSSVVLLAVAAGWAAALRRLFSDPALDRFDRLAPPLLAVAVLLYLLAVAGSYLIIAFESGRQAESRALELQVRAREAELGALKARQEQELAERELQLARSIQQRLLPPPAIEGEGFRIAARNLPARFVAGDYYDVFRLADGCLGLVVADVAGKGMGASLIMASVKAMLPLVAESSSVPATLAELNRRLAGELSSREFVALCFGRYDPKLGRLDLANAGLPDPYLLRRGRGARPLEVPGPRLPLGVRSGVSYQSLALRLEPGERVVWLTDGLPEAPTEAGEPLGYAGLEGLFPADAAGPGEWLEALLAALEGATRPGLEDDWTALVLERTA
jgi:serine phosphatase RsbU (regulator of sigma subunit)